MSARAYYRSTGAGTRRSYLRYGLCADKAMIVFGYCYGGDMIMCCFVVRSCYDTVVLCFVIVKLLV